MAARELSRLPGWRVHGVPILGYHGLSGADGKTGTAARERKYWVRDTEFRDQLKCIRQRGFRVIRIGEMCPSAVGAKSATKAVVLSFDDGLASQYDRALPLLEEFAHSACFFVNTATIGESGFLTWAQIAEMQRAGMAFHSHSHHHVYLSRLSQAAMEGEMKNSRLILEDHLGCPVRVLSAPFGDTSRRVVETALAAGYEAVCNSHFWPAQPGSVVLSRAVVYNTTSRGDYERLIAGDAQIYLKHALREKALSVPKRILLRVWPAPAPSGRLTSVEEK